MHKKLKILLPALLLAVFCIIQHFGLTTGLDNAINDKLLASPREPMRNIVIVGMDERSITEIGQWPWPRFYMADTIEKVAGMGAAAIGANILYDTYGASEEHDMALVEAAGRTDRLILGAMAFFDETSRYGAYDAEDYVLPFEDLAEATGVGFLNVERDADRVLRKALTQVRYGDITIRSLPFEVYKTYCRVTGIEENALALDSFGRFSVNYVSGPRGFQMLPLWEVINDEHDPAVFRDSIVLIGPYTQGIGQEDNTTPLDKGTPTYGIEIYANIIQNMLEGNFRQDASGWLNLLVLAILGIAAIVLMNRFKPLWGAVATVALVVVQLAVARLVCTQLNLIMKPGDGLLFLIVCYAAVFVLNILAMQREKLHIQGLFGRFVAPEVVNEIISGNVDVQLGGTEKEITVLFVDIRGFTAFSEANPPEKVVSMVNRYLALTSRSIQENGGTIDKYIGDATMAVFNAPNNLPNHALCAVKAAWAMKVGAESLREEIIQNYGVDLQFGVGVNTGLAVVGNMGSDFRMEYTAIGDTVNTAARLESNSQKGQVLISDATYQIVKEHVEVTDLGVINVKNKKTGIQIYSLEGVLD